jgi:HSP20 family protein
MALVKWHPLRELDEIRRDMDRMFGDFLEPPRRRAQRFRGGLAAPSVELVDRGTEVVLRAELPGVRKEDVDLTVHDEAITVMGEFKRDETVKDEDYYFSERRYGHFERTVPLPEEVDADRAKASFKDGVLEVVLPKKEEAKPRERKLKVE